MKFSPQNGGAGWGLSDGPFWRGRFDSNRKRRYRSIRIPRAVYELQLCRARWSTTCTFMAMRIPFEAILKTRPLRLRMEQAFRTSHLVRRCVQP
jgi:hypothetical protein